MAFDSAGYLALSGLLLSTVALLLHEPMLSLSLKGTHNFSGFVPVQAYLFILNPLTFYLNMLLLIRHVAGHPTPHIDIAPLPVFLTNHLPPAAQIFSFFTLLLGLPLWIQLALSEEKHWFAIGAVLLYIALIAVLTSVFCKNYFMTYHYDGRGFVQALFGLCISTGILVFFDPVLSSPNTNHSEVPLMSMALHYLLLFVIFFIFILGIILVILCIGAPAAGNQAMYVVTVSLSLAMSILLVGVYIQLFLAISDIGAADQK